MRAIQVRTNQVEQFRALDQSPLDRAPFATIEQHGHNVERPRPAARLGVGIDVVGGPVLAQDLPNLDAAPAQFGRAEGAERTHRIHPVRSRTGVRSVHFVEAGRRTMQAFILGQQIIRWPIFIDLGRGGNEIRHASLPSAYPTSV